MKAKGEKGGSSAGKVPLNLPAGGSGGLPGEELVQTYLHTVRRMKGEKLTQTRWPEENLKQQYFDEMTGVELPRKLVTQAMREELDYFEDTPVWEQVSVEDAKAA